MERSDPSGTLYRMAAFTAVPNGGNPAGVWIGEALPAAEEMQRIATDVGFPATAFIAPTAGNARTVRYYSQMAELLFCGHATIASGVLLGTLAGDGAYQYATAVGDVSVDVGTQNGRREAALTSVTPRHESVSCAFMDATLAALGWNRSELDPSIPPARIFAGLWQLVIAVTSRERLANLAYDFDALKTLMLERGLTTLQLIYRERTELFHSRSPFPTGGVFEDPATGSAAAALGGYLRDAGLLVAPSSFEIHQGDDMGRPSRIFVDVPPSGGVVVRGTAVRLD